MLLTFSSKTLAEVDAGCPSVTIHDTYSPVVSAPWTSDKAVGHHYYGHNIFTSNMHLNFPMVFFLRRNLNNESSCDNFL